MYFYGYYGMFAMLPVIILGILVQIRLKNVYSKYSTTGNSRNITGADMAKMVLNNAGIYDVQISCIGGNLSDNYNPVKKVVSLSNDVYNGTSIAAIGIAAHECGHAIQHHKQYFPIRLRSAIVGITNFSSKLLYFLMLGSFLIYSSPMSTTIFNIATLCYAVLFFFQLVTLPVEFNASSRALKQIEASGFSDADLGGVKKVLSSAAMTYVASAVTALWQLLLMLSRARNRR